VNRRIFDELPDLISFLATKKTGEFNAFLGFDACIDIIVRVVREHNEDNSTSFFSESSQFGDFLKNLKDHSCGLELQTRFSKPGGNMVITGNALGNLGVVSDCIGTYGFPEILPVFKVMSENCRLITIGETITATALEFDSSKVIMFDPGPYKNLNWNSIRDLIGIEKLKDLISGKQLVAFVNWSEIENSSIIWKGFLDEVVPVISFAEARPLFFTDFSDCSRRSKEDIKKAIYLLGRFREYFRVIISLNRNEATLVAAALDIPDKTSDEDFIRALYLATNADIITIHRVDDALAFDGVSYERCNTFICKNPLILTGGGDNFNAGFCFAVLNRLNLFQALILANAVSGSYVKTGVSPTLAGLTEFLKQKDIL
jgi:hypothetical protein